jgi:hypothetical protein
LILRKKWGVREEERAGEERSGKGGRRRRGLADQNEGRS